MNSQERREARYQRRKAKRQAKKQARSDSLGSVDQVFSYRKMFSMAVSAVMGCGGSKVFKTLKPTFFQEQPNGGGKYWMEHGNQKAVPILPFGSVERYGLLTHHTLQIGKFTRPFAMKFLFRCITPV